MKNKVKPWLAMFLCLSFLPFQLNALTTHETFHWSGKVYVDGVAYTGVGNFVFVIYNPISGTILWTSKDSATWINQNVGALTPGAVAGITLFTVNVNQGIAQTPLGAPLMDAINPNVYQQTLSIRVYFSTPTRALLHLAPDQELHAVPYALKIPGVDISSTGAVNFTQSIVINNIPFVSANGQLVDRTTGLVGSPSYMYAGPGNWVLMQACTPTQKSYWSGSAWLCTEDLY